MSMQPIQDPIPKKNQNKRKPEALYKQEPE